MSLRVGYLARTDRGDRPESVRLIGLRADEAWHASKSGENGFTPAQHVSIQCDEAARWTVERLREAKSRRLDVLCVDACGAGSSWLSTPSRGPAVVQAAYRQLGGFGLDRAGGADGAWDSAEPAIQPLASTGAASEAGNVRIGAIAQHDACVGLYIDRLDRTGVRVPCVLSLWQALALAWDPSASPSAATSSRQTTVTAIVMLDPAGRIVWVWSQAAEPVAAGSAWARRAGSNEGLAVSQPVVSRLSADWLAWSAQVGRTPERIVIVTPGFDSDPTGISHSQFGEALSALWPDAPLTMGVHDDPVGATLARLIDSDALHGADAPDSAKSMTRLTRRAGLAHRSMYVWAGAALLAMSAGLIALSAKWLMASGRVDSERLALANNAVDYARDYNQKLAQSMFLSREIDAMISQRVGGPVKTDFPPEQPILEELSIISGVLSGFASEGDEFKVNEISLSSASRPRIECVVPNVAFGETLYSFLKDESDTHINWELKFRPNTTVLTLDGTWMERTPEPGGGQ